MKQFTVKDRYRNWSVPPVRSIFYLVFSAVSISFLFKCKKFWIDNPMRKWLSISTSWIDGKGSIHHFGKFCWNKFIFAEFLGNTLGFFSIPIGLFISNINGGGGGRGRISNRSLPTVEWLSNICSLLRIINPWMCVLLETGNRFPRHLSNLFLDKLILRLKLKLDRINL